MLPIVMVVDRDAAFRKTAKAALDGRATVLEAVNPGAARTLAYARAPVALICDLGIGGPGEGLELLRQMRRWHPACARVLAVADDVGPTAVRLGLADVAVHKPCGEADIRDAFEKVMAPRQPMAPQMLGQLTVRMGSDGAWTVRTPSACCAFVWRPGGRLGTGSIVLTSKDCDKCRAQIVSWSARRGYEMIETR